MQHAPNLSKKGDVGSFQNWLAMFLGRPWVFSAPGRIQFPTRRPTATLPGAQEYPLGLTRDPRHSSSAAFRVEGFRVDSLVVFGFRVLGF